MNASDLVSLAQAELAETRAEEFKIFLLAVMAGLRRSEIDLLEWPAFNFSQAVIRIRVTEHFKPKSVDSIGDVVIDDQVNRIFLEYEKKKVGTFVIESENPPRPDAICQYYRCDKIFKALLAWLRLKGILTDKPLHTLRKEFGSLLCERGGIYEASRALRHADIRTTSAHYLDSKRRVTVGLGDSLVKHDR